MEIDEPFFETLELTADLLQLDETRVDLAGDVVDLGLEAELVGRLPPVGAGLGRDELITSDEVLPSGIERRDVLDHPFDQRERPVGFGQREELMGQ